MSGKLLRQHLFRAWSKHWALQAASVTVMMVVLMIMNLLFLGFSAFNRTVEQWGRGLEMIVYVKEGAPQVFLEKLRAEIEASGDFDSISFTPKSEATKKFLQALGPDSLELLKDPKWNSPIPASFELRLSRSIPADQRVASLEAWSSKFQTFSDIDDVFYGQGWVENFSRFLASARGLVVMIWILSLSVGLLIISNCIRLSFMQRREEIEILELVGATARFIRVPFLVEGLVLGVLASMGSLLLSYAVHAALLTWLGGQWSFWLALRDLSPLQFWYIAANLLAGMGFGALGAWNCVRQLNTGWSAAAG